MAAPCSLQDVVELPERTFLRRVCVASKQLMKTYKEFEKNYVAQFKTEQVTAQNAAVLAGRLTRMSSGLGHADMKNLVREPEAARTARRHRFVRRWLAKSFRVECVGAGAQRRHGCVVRSWHTESRSTRKEFIEGDYEILLGSPKMFGTGLNLQCAKYQLWLSRSWSLLEREQALARNYRAGQTEKTIVVDYITADTIDERVLTAWKTKTDLSQRNHRRQGVI